MIHIYAQIPLQNESATCVIRKTWNSKHALPPLEYWSNLVVEGTQYIERLLSIKETLYLWKDCYEQSDFLSTRETLYQRNDCCQWRDFPPMTKLVLRVGLNLTTNSMGPFLWRSLRCVSVQNGDIGLYKYVLLFYPLVYLSVWGFLCLGSRAFMFLLD